MARSSGPIRSVSNPNVHTGNETSTAQNNGFICQSGSLGSSSSPPTDALIIEAVANSSASATLTLVNASQSVGASVLTIPDLAGVNSVVSVVNSANFAQEKVATITAGTVQTQAGATAITASIAYVTTGTAGDGVILPALSAAKVGTRVQLINASANAGTVYCPGATSTNTINGTAGATGVTYAASKTLFLVAVSATAWVSTLSN